MKKATLQIKQILDLDDPVSKALFTLGMATVIMGLMMSGLTMMSVEHAIEQLVHILFMLYVLSCFKNGDCNIFAFIVSMLTIGLLLAELAIGIFRI